MENFMFCAVFEDFPYFHRGISKAYFILLNESLL